MVKIERHQKGNKRWYTVEGDPRVEGLELPNCTGILNIINKPALVGWARNDEAKLYQEAIQELTSLVPPDHKVLLNFGAAVSERVKELKTRKGPMERGTDAHEQVEQYLNKALAAKTTAEIVRPGDLVAANASAFLTDYGIKIMGTEVMAYHPELKYGCTVDAWGLQVGSNDQIIIDWKTGSIYPESALQIAANTMALCHTLLISTDTPNLRGMVVHLETQKPGYEVKEVNLGESWERFKAALELSKLSKAVWLE